MKKEKKFFRFSLFGIVVFALVLTLNASATQIEINHAVPTAQGYVTLPSGVKSKTSDYGIVNLSKKDPSAVTFSARAWKTEGKWGSYASGVVVDDVGKNFNIPYAYNLGQGSIVQARFRNHNWSLNSNQIEGTLNYQ